MANPRAVNKLYAAPELSARKAGLSYALGEARGYSRVRRGKGFSYVDSGGRPVAKEKIPHLSMIRIPPAWTDVWISPDENAHLLATGRDERGRKQYVYHPKWSELRNSLKFGRLAEFAEALPKLRSAISRNLRTHGVSRERVVAAALKLIDELHIRVGNDEYARTNRTYGITTLRDRHVDIDRGTVSLAFTGKSNKKHELEVEDPLLAHVVKRSRDIPGDRLFQYFDEENEKRPLASAELNDFIRTVTGRDFTAKDFRTWAATAHAYELMKEECACDDHDAWTKKRRADKTREIIESVAEKLGNTPAICKSHYVHRELRELFERGELKALIADIKAGQAKGLKRHEAELKALLAKLARGG